MQHFHSQCASVCFISLICVCNVRSAATCYYPNGDEAGYDRPCKTTSGDVACCGRSAYCLANGYCLNQLVLTRGSCTDQSWKSSACALDCKNFNSSSGYFLTSCSIDDRLWSCEDCEESNFTVQTGLLFRDYQVASLGLSSDVTIQAQSPISVATVTSSSSPISTSVTVVTTSVSSSPSDCISLLEVENQKSLIRSDSQKKQAAIGAGVGVPLGLAAVAFLILFFLERRKRDHTAGKGESAVAEYREQKDAVTNPKPQQLAVPPTELHPQDVAEVVPPIELHPQYVAEVYSEVGHNHNKHSPYGYPEM